jgi:phage terminase Nu1 subunit (DNA packaging protein)
MGLARRLTMPDASDNQPPADTAQPAQPPALPWMHGTLVSLATGLGCSVRTLENWRPRGAPIAAVGPWDELAVRLWVHAEQISGKAMKRLADASPALAPYVAQLAKARLPRGTAPRAAGDGLKRKQSQFLDIKMAERQKLAQQQATDAFLGVLGRLDQLFEREVSGQLTQRLWDLANGQTASQSLPPMAVLLRDTYRAVRRRALGK